jgi:ribosome biogenesis GTPase / thiamine phosphate phosphatase
VTPRSRRRYDESDVRVRPNPKGSRPRTKERPLHSDAVPARVLTVDRGRVTVLAGEGTDDERVIVAMKARELGRTGIVVGDRVDVVGDVSGTDDTLARVVRRQPRATLLRRTADDTDPVERVIVANADQLVIVTAVAEPEPRARMVDRCLVAAYDAGIRPLLCLTKADLADPAEFLSAYRDLDMVTVVTHRADGTIAGLDLLLDQLRGRDSVLVGHSGVGKSTLVNALVPEALRATGIVNAVTGRGRHTSSSAVALRLPDDDGWVTDTPGVRSFGLAHVDPQHLLRAFEDLQPGSAECPRGCTHDEPECGLDAWVASGAAGPHAAARLESLRRLLRSRTTDTTSTEDR